MKIDPSKFKPRLEEEKKHLETELLEVARKNPDSPSKWQPVLTERDTSQADENLLADSIEDYVENVAITNSLAARYKDVRSALNKIEKNVYGLCQVCKKEIELDRLEANPAARTCKEHVNAL